MLTYNVMLQVYSKVTQLHIHTFFFRFFSLMKVKSLSRVRLFVTPWTEAHQAPRYMGFSRQEYSSVLPFPSPGDLPDPEIEPRSPALQADALTSEPPRKPLFPYQIRSDQSLSRVWLFVTPWTEAHQAPLFMEFSRREYCSGLPLPPPGDLPNPGIKLTSPAAPALQVESLPLSHWGSP